MYEPTPIKDRRVYYTLDLDTIFIDVSIEVYSDGRWNDFDVICVHVYNEQNDSWETPDKTTQNQIAEQHRKSIKEALDAKF